MRILGIDPGLCTTGYGLVEITPTGPRFVEAGRLRIKRELPMPKRLLELWIETKNLLADLEPDYVAVEKCFAGRNRGGSAITLSHARGVILACCAATHAPIYEFTATEIKAALTGSGSASKQQVQACVLLTLGQDIKMSLDSSDALAAALCATNRITGVAA